MVYGEKPKGKVIHVQVTSVPAETRTVEVRPVGASEKGEDMAQVISKRQLEIFECETEDGGVGLKFGDGPLFMGYDERDLARLLEQVFTGAYTKPSFIDAELYDLAHMYLDEATAQERYEELRG